MNTFFGFVVGLLQATLSMLGFAQQHPEIPPAQQQQATEVTQQTAKNHYNLPTSPIDSYGCYWRRDNNVVATYISSTSLSPVTKVVSGADVESFQDLSGKGPADQGDCFGKDKNEVYFYDQVLAWADPKTFTVIAHFPNRVWFLRNKNEILSWQESDDNTSSTIQTSCTSGITEGFCAVPNSDPASFKEIDTGTDKMPWAKDKNNVYCLGQIIQGADPSSVKIIGFQHLEMNVNGTSQIFGGGVNPCLAGASSNVSVPGMSKYTDSDFGFSFWYPSGWTPTNKKTQALVNIDLESAQYADIDGPAMLILATTTWPRDPKIYKDGTEQDLDGTASSFATLYAQADGTSKRVGNQIFAKIKNTTVSNIPAVLISSHTSPDVPTEPFDEEIYWLRRGNVNWYIYVYGPSSDTAHDDLERVISSISFTQ